jgi:hypothetical protein
MDVFTGLALKQRYVLAKEFRGVCPARPGSLFLSFFLRSPFASELSESLQSIHVLPIE